MQVPLGDRATIQDLRSVKYDFLLVLHASKFGITPASPFLLTFSVITINLLMASHR